MVFLNFRQRVVLPFVVLVVIASGCKGKVRVLSSPSHYNFSMGLAQKLEPKLLEISGLAWDTKSKFFLAVSDESDKLYFLDKENKIIKEEYVIGDKGDYEDVAILNGVPYILRSDGMITKFVKDSTGKAGVPIDIGTISLSGTNDFETMYADPGRNALVLICKNCKTDNDDAVSAFAFYPDSIGFDNKPLFVIDAKKVKELAPVKSSKFQPSAAAIHPIQQKLFILSSASKEMAIADLNGNIESVYRLSPKLFPQPEGITFQPDGDMYISNEGLRTRKPTLLKFEYVAVNDSEKVQVTKTGYNFSTPDEKMELGKQLHEISGMAYVPGLNVILAENDEKGDIFMVDFKNKNDNVGKVKFGGKGDYEDIVHTDTAEYMLISSGTIVQVMTKDSSFATRDFTLDRGGSSEFETMYIGADKKSLVLLCKDCSKEKNQVRTAYRFDLTTLTFSPDPLYIIDISTIQKMLNDDKAEFKPSAAAISPITGKLFIVASVGKVLVIADTNGKVEQVFPLDPVLYNQPEGMTFAPNGDLYISNEGGEGIPTILKFVYKK